MQNEGETAPPTRPAWTGQRGVSAAMASVILIVVIVVVGAGGYYGLAAAGGTTSKTTTSCTPPTSSVCSSLSPNHDVLLNVLGPARGGGQTVPTIQQGGTVTAIVSVANGETVSGFTVNWGDGSSTTKTTSQFTHSYSALGTFIISATAQVGSSTHDGPGELSVVSVTPSVQTQTAGTFPTLQTSSGGGTPFPLTGGVFDYLSAGATNTLSFSGQYVAAPSDPSYSAGTPSFTASTAAKAGTIPTPTPSSASANYTFTSAASGIYWVTFVSPISGAANLYQNYTWTVYVAPTGLTPNCGSCASGGSGGKTYTSPHPGQLDIYEIAPGGATTEDPAIAYDTVSYEPIINVYQNLVVYNGSSTATFVPELATCVPTTAQCNSLYGSSLVANNGAGQPTYWTFVIDKNAQFYDPSTKAHWGVYPTDVMFSLARTLSFADLPSVAVDNGWINAQALLPFGNRGWDSGIHFPFNNSPANVLGSMLVNDSTYCTATLLAAGNGCITFNASGGGTDWPFFLQLIADPLGAGVTPCGWFTSVGAGIPGWSGTSVSGGDGPCLLPNGGTSTSTSAWTSYLAGLSPTSWDTFQQLANNHPAVQPAVRWAMVGSGPYYAVPGSISQAVGYTLMANPYYVAPTGCAGTAGCEPLPGHYASLVNVKWDPDDTIGIQQYLAGQADAAGIFTTDTGTLLQLQAAGKVVVTNAPTISIFFFPIALNFSVPNELANDPTGQLNIPNDFFAHVGLRNFLTYAYPYQTLEQTVQTVDGIQFGFNYGGAIPVYMGNYYPTNISWPSTDPNTNAATVGGAAWWWAQASSNTSSPYYDAELAACTASAPCKFPTIGQAGAPNLDAIESAYDASIASLTGGALQPYTFDMTFTNLIVICDFASPGTNACPFWNLGWAPDYPDPTDYIAPLYAPDSTYTAPDAVAEMTNTPAFMSPSCVHPSGTAADAWYWAYTASGVPDNCQGYAYDAMVALENVAASLLPGPQRILDYNAVEHIGKDLGLYVYYTQSQGVGSNAPWINGASVNNNVMIGGGGDQTWYSWAGNGVAG